MSYGMTAFFREKPGKLRTFVKKFARKPILVKFGDMISFGIPSGRNPLIRCSSYGEDLRILVFGEGHLERVSARRWKWKIGGIRVPNISAWKVTSSSGNYFRAIEPNSIPRGEFIIWGGMRTIQKRLGKKNGLSKLLKILEEAKPTISS